VADLILITVSATVDPAREQELLDGFRKLMAELPEGLLRTELLRGQDGGWRIASLWRDRAALMAARESGQRPAALALFERVGAEHSHDVFTVEASS
jgi:quinol monooxygenase YgiN